jgi:hypothetical protein
MKLMKLFKIKNTFKPKEMAQPKPQFFLNFKKKMKLKEILLLE